AAESCGGAEGIGVVDQAAAHDGDGLEAAMGMLREAGDGAAVVHPPTVLAGEVHADLASFERRGGAELVVAGRVGGSGVAAEQEWIERRPLKTQRHDRENVGIGHGRSLFMRRVRRNWAVW